MDKYDPVTKEILREYDLVSLGSAFSSVRFWQYFFMLFAANVFGGSFSYLYKSIGLKNDISDHDLAWAASSSAIVQAISRLGFGYLYDICGFKTLFNVLMIINAVNSFLSYNMKTIAWAYFGCI